MNTVNLAVVDAGHALQAALVHEMRMTIWPKGTLGFEAKWPRSVSQHATQNQQRKYHNATIRQTDTAFGAKQRQSQTPGSTPRSSLPAGVQAREMAPQASWPTQSNDGNRDNKRKRKRRNNTRQEVAKGEGSSWKPARTNKRHKLKQCRHASMPLSFWLKLRALAFLR